MTDDDLAARLAAQGDQPEPLFEVDPQLAAERAAHAVTLRELALAHKEIDRLMAAAIECHRRTDLIALAVKR